MKKIILISGITLTTLLSCNKKASTNAFIVRDCTGTYLRIDKKDYQVCNLEKVAAFEDNSAVTVSFKKLSKCNGSAKDAIVCMMLHANEGWIEVLDIKQ